MLSRYLVSREVDFSGEDEEVVVGETTVRLRVHELRDGEAIGVLVSLEVVESGGGVEEGLVWHCEQVS